MKAFMGCSEEVKDLEDPREEHHEIFLGVRVGGDLVGAWALWELAGPEGYGEVTNFRGTDNLGHAGPEPDGQLANSPGPSTMPDQSPDSQILCQIRCQIECQTECLNVCQIECAR
jgi:hypothetical protein